MTNPNTLLIRLLTRLRDMRLVWDIMGSLYNGRIYNLIEELYDDIAKDLDTPDQAQILDAGAGRGYLSVALASRNPDSHVTGVDYSRMQVRRAERYRREKKIPNCSFRQNNVLSLDFQNAVFDAAVSVGSIKHWPDSRRGLAELYRVCKPGSCLIISETDRDVPDNELRKFVQRFRLPFVPEDLLFWGLRHVVFGQSFSQDQLADAVRLAGFRNIESHKVKACPYVIVKAWK
ncbi:MAG TPA: class I SAM-dependent methyltransferase [Smithella sp.]|nr:class I SAM-dependent methyltransferase [Smithella sp.]